MEIAFVETDITRSDDPSCLIHTDQIHTAVGALIAIESTHPGRRHHFSCSGTNFRVPNVHISPAAKGSDCLDGGFMILSWHIREPSEPLVRALVVRVC